MKLELYIYGSENPKDNGKCHISDDKGIICGNKIKWGECTAVIEKAIPNDEYKEKYNLLVSTFGGGKNQMLDISTSWKYDSCKHCEKRLKQLLSDHYI